MTTDLNLVSAFLIGLAGSVHCIGMCGGVVSALSFAIPRQKAAWPYHLAYNFGRIFSYSVAGAITGSLGGIATYGISGAGVWLGMISAIFLILLGLYLGQWWTVLSRLESLGHRIWRRLQPLGKRWVPFKNPFYALGYGIVWGWLPCGLVYSTLTWSMASGSALMGAGVMFAFGLGTLPALLTVGSSATTVRELMANALFRKTISLILVLTGLILLGANVHNAWVN
ncbi:sulfite exporter TauE/SafE family protein [Aestuariibacter halophilus]|uniref:Sulfite exporter TauE/SafE family protein n=1 Tax=Fluctibacter halophilus TaxID=226011 RepID=A0ABS8G581_9ALTE|nr:sulfite exporter TauE/SafE family protein [Aestuariibacter halophilus]MCC2615710.1 sulfite exporter TauE/SafE family protein [Aestuariibacter halophilus]